jgi:hypothetical protein
MPENDTRSIDGRGAVRLENDRICVFERNGVYQARIRTEANRYLWRSLKTRNQFQAISAARRLFHSIEFRQQSGLPLTNRSFNRVIDEYVALRERQQIQGRTSSSTAPNIGLSHTSSMYKLYCRDRSGYVVRPIATRPCPWRRRQPNVDSSGAGANGNSRQNLGTLD